MPIEPVALADFFLSFFSAAMIILLGTLYAGLFAWAKISARHGFKLAAGLVYLALVFTVIVFSRINHFDDSWLILSCLMVVGYGGMPYLIWRLCAATHTDSPEHLHQPGGRHD